MSCSLALPLLPRPLLLITTEPLPYPSSRSPSAGVTAYLLFQIEPKQTRTTMSSSRRSSSSSQQQSSGRISDDQIIDLISRLQQVLPEIRQRRSDKVYNQLSLSPSPSTT